MQSFCTRYRRILRKLPGVRVARFLLDLFKGTESRNAALLLLRPPKGLYQPFGTTSADRYPEIFRFVRESVGDGTGVRVLSFGCSTGEEVFSLRSYFSQATLTGLDINPFNVAVCRIRCLKAGGKKMSFAVAGSTAGENTASYDAIFAMAVFRHGNLNISPPPSMCAPLLHFASFEQSVADLARVLKPGGLLVIQHAMFRFCDTRAARGFDVALNIQAHELEPFYGRDNCLLPDAAYSDIVFRKLR
jgi:SAM-dependent methyltransferase